MTIQPNHEAFIMPTQEEGSVGFDCYCAEVRYENDLITFDLGFSAAPPKGYYFELVPRSSITKYDLLMANSFGVIDPNYRGNLMMKCKPATRVGMGRDGKPFCMTPGNVWDFKVYAVGEKCCQIILRKIEPIKPKIGTLDETNRKGGFGSTGV